MNRDLSRYVSICLDSVSVILTAGFDDPGDILAGSRSHVVALRVSVPEHASVHEAPEHPARRAVDRLSFPEALTEPPLDLPGGHHVLQAAAAAP